MRGELQYSNNLQQRCRITPAYAGRTGLPASRRRHHQDHPRVCGENGAMKISLRSPRGSPPRMRGERRRACAGALRWRITPAYAGRTSSVTRHACAARDHPRICGENLFGHRMDDPEMGSPPRMRGELAGDGDGVARRRITPAYAGRTHPRWRGGQLKSDHPRVCGENFCGPRPARRPIGSPPRMRGELLGDRSCPGVGRITPAYAGRTAPPRSRPCCGPDHPRVCGENSTSGFVVLLALGSPPRMRGELMPPPPGRLGPRITPAYAGRTAETPGASPSSRDHPRVCGENGLGAQRGVQIGGSPPRMRGERAVADVVPRRCGITPAYAGRTRIPSPPRHSRADHPRVCGENMPVRVRGAGPVGSPPRMRGERGLASRVPSW